MEPNWLGKILRTLCALGAYGPALRLLRSRRLPLDDGLEDVAIQLDVLLGNGCLIEAFQFQVRAVPTRASNIPVHSCGTEQGEGCVGVQRQHRHIGPHALLQQLVQYFFQSGEC